MATTLDLLKWSSMTAAINEIKGPQSFLRRLLFPRVETKPTETIELSMYTGDREVAPFIKKNGEAEMVEGLGETFQTVEAPNIRIKRPFTPSDALFNRRPGTVIFPDAGTIAREAARHVSREVARLEDYILNAEEYLCAMASGCQSGDATISYSVEGGDAFTITFPRDATHKYTLGTLWSAAPTTVDIQVDILKVKRLISDATGLSTDICIMGQNAAEAFMKVMKNQTNNMLDIRNFEAGSVTINEQFRDSGAIYLGRFGGIEWWEYARKVNVDGVATDLVAPTYAHFFSLSARAERTMYYGAIPDWKTLRGRRFQGRRFAKSWEQEDPSVRWALAASRPLPVPRRPDASVSVVVSA